jgi:hypothetical protein
VAKLAKGELERFHALASRFVARSAVLEDLVAEVQLARGRIYFWRGEDDLMARVTPLSRRTLLLEEPRGNGWSEHKRGSLRTVLGALERDIYGTFHGLGALVRKRKGGEASVQEVLHRDFGVPLRVLAEPRHWYSMRRTPKIVEANRERARVLVRFEAFGPSGPFHGTCLYVRADGEWDCYTIKPSASGSIAAAEACWSNAAGRTGADRGVRNDAGRVIADRWARRSLACTHRAGSVLSNRVAARSRHENSSPVPVDRALRFARRFLRVAFAAAAPVRASSLARAALISRRRATTSSRTSSGQRASKKLPLSGAANSSGVYARA